MDYTVSGRIVDVLLPGTCRSVIIVYGLDIIISPSLRPDITSPATTDTETGDGVIAGASISSKHTQHASKVKYKGSSTCLLPSEISLKIGLITVVRKPNLDLSFMSPLLTSDNAHLDSTKTEKDSDTGKKSEGQNERNNSLEDGSACTAHSSVQFPHNDGDLSSALIRIIELDGINSNTGNTTTTATTAAATAVVGESVDKLPPLTLGQVKESEVEMQSDSLPAGQLCPLLKVRFEASMASISLSVSTEHSSNASNAKIVLATETSGRNVPQKDIKNQERKMLIQPFSLHYVTSLDINPFLIPPLHTQSQSAYNRQYYLVPNESTISTSYLSVERLVIETSLLDMVRAIHTVEDTVHAVRSSRGYQFLFNTPPHPVTHTTTITSTPSSPSTLILTSEGIADGVLDPPILLTDPPGDRTDLPLPLNSSSTTSSSSSSSSSSTPNINDTSVTTERHASVFILKTSDIDVRVTPTYDDSKPAVLDFFTKFVHCIIEKPLKVSLVPKFDSACLSTSVPALASVRALPVPALVPAFDHYPVSVLVTDDLLDIGDYSVKESDVSRGVVDCFEDINLEEPLCECITAVDGTSDSAVGVAGAGDVSVEEADTEEKGEEKGENNGEEKREKRGDERGVMKGEAEVEMESNGRASVEAHDEADDPEDWNEWICEDQATPPRDEFTPTIPVPRPTPAPTPIPTIHTQTQPDKNQNQNRTQAHTQTKTQAHTQSSTLMKIGCGKLVLSSSGKPLFYFLGDSTVECAMTHVTQDKRAEIAAGDGASFVQLRCEWNEVVQEEVLNQNNDSVFISSIDHNDESLLNNRRASVDTDKMGCFTDTAQSPTSTSTSTSNSSTSTMSLFMKLPGRKIDVNTSFPINVDDDVILKTDGTGKNGGAKMAQIVLVPQLMREAVRGMLTELLEGYG